MSAKGLVTVWVLFFLAIFSLGYLTTHIIVTRAMSDFRVKGTGYTSLEVKPNYGTQHNQVYAEQPAHNVQAQ